MLAGVVVCFHFELLPRWALIVLAARELFMLVLSQYALRKGMDLKINMVGRWAVWPVMFAIFLTLLVDTLGGGGLALSGAGPHTVGDGDLRAGRLAVHQSLKLDLTPGSILAARQSPKGSRRRMDTFPDLGALSDTELKEMIQQLTDEEQEVSYQRRILHGKIDILRAELVNRLRKKHEEGESAITGADVQQLTDILSGKAIPDADRE